MPVKLEFANHSSDEEGDEEEKKESNVQLTKENYKQIFPTLGQANK